MRYERKLITKSMKRVEKCYMCRRYETATPQTNTTQYIER